MKLTEIKFLENVKTHSMHVLHDDGIYRHLRFKRPGTNCMHFDLVTWPGYLAYSGDMGTYVFTRLHDMFEFFRTDRDYAHRKGRKLGINLSYWAEKVEGRDRDGIKEFSEERFTAEVKDYFHQWMVGNRDRTTKEERRELWEQITDEVINTDGDPRGMRKQIALHDFSHRVNDKAGDFYFSDWEQSADEYTHRFVWCCYALAWVIQTYDDAKTSEEKTLPREATA